MSLPRRVTDAKLAEVAAAFAGWRSSTRPRSRIPEELWSRAIELAATHGVCKIATALRLDYYTLKRRLTAEVETVAQPPAFVECKLDLPIAAPGCVVALSDRRGRLLRIELPRAAASEVAALARSLWQAAQ
jgi:hypothetical protein